MRQTTELLCLLGLVVLAVVSAQYQGHPNQAYQQPHHQQVPPQPHDQRQQSEHHENFLEKQDIEHIKHDVKDQYYMDLDGKTDQKELNYYNFKLHDYDNNQLLDGLEILMALNHDHNAEHVSDKSENAERANRGDKEKQEETQSKFDKDAEVIDLILNDYDSDMDGFISYSEYSLVRAKYP